MMLKKRILTGVVIIFSLWLVYVVVMSSQFCYLNMTSCKRSNSRPYLIKAKIIERSAEKTVFSNLEPFVVLDKHIAMAVIRDRAEDWPKGAKEPSSNDTLSAAGEVFSEVALNQEVWFKYYVAERRIEKVF